MADTPPGTLNPLAQDPQPTPRGRLFIVVLVLAALAMIIVTYATVQVISLNQNTLRTVQVLAEKNSREIEAHRIRDRQALCSAELHHHASLEAILAIGRQADLKTEGLHISVDADIEEFCRTSDPRFAEELDRVHERADKIAPLSPVSRRQRSNDDEVTP